MIEKNAKFYFANLGADVARCIRAAMSNNESLYDSSLIRARRTLGFLRSSKNFEAYEEGLLLLRALNFAKQKGALQEFSCVFNVMISRMSPLVHSSVVP